MALAGDAGEKRNCTEVWPPRAITMSGSGSDVAVHIVIAVDEPVRGRSRVSGEPDE